MNPPSRLLLLFSIAGVALAMILCASFASLSSQRLELIHLTYFNACAIHSYQYHWQNADRLQTKFHYDFTMSPISFVLAEVWVVDGPILKFSQKMPIECRLSATQGPLYSPL